MTEVYLLSANPSGRENIEKEKLNRNASKVSTWEV